MRAPRSLSRVFDRPTVSLRDRVGRPTTGLGYGGGSALVAGSGRRGVRVGPMSARNSFGQSDLTPPRGRPRFRKPACRSDACGEVLMNWLVRTSTPAHDRQALLMKMTLAPLGGCLGCLDGSFLYGTRELTRWPRGTTRPTPSGTDIRGTVLAWRSNKAMKLTRCGLEASSSMELGPSSGRTAVIERGLRRVRPSQLIASVRPTGGGAAWE